MAGRTLHGVNLTGWLTLESWVTPGLFAPYGALDEPSLIHALGRTAYHELVRRHRASFIQQEDFSRIASRGFNAVRLPVPWYVFGDAGPTPGPYLGCIDYVDKAFDWAEEIGLNVLLALAISPGAAPIDGASSHYFSDLRAYRDRALDVIAALSRRYASRMGFFGLALAEEVRPQVRHGLTLTDGVPKHVLRNYYRDAYDTVRDIAGPEVFVVMPDGGEPAALRRFVSSGRFENVWIDCDLSREVAKVDVVGPAGVRKIVNATKRHLADAGLASSLASVGKWSASLPYADSMMTPEGRVAIERIYVSEQLGVYEQLPGWFFQTWKTEGLLASWDARVALATFERGMIV